MLISNRYVLSLFLVSSALLPYAREACASTMVAFDHPYISYQGRLDASEGRAEFDWPCTGISLVLDGFGEVSVSIDGGGNRFRLQVDASEQVIALPPGKQQLRLANFATPGQHHIHLQKLTEASYMFPFFTSQKSVKIYGLERDASLSLVEPARPKMRLEFFGDSAMNGFGVKKSSSLGALSKILELEDCSKSYPIKVGAELEADVHLEAWSGKGVVKNAFGLLDFGAKPMPTYWRQTLATDPKKAWDFAQWLPDAVILQLGANDFYLHPYPSAEAFKSGYRALVEDIIAAYAPAQPAIINVCGFDNHDFDDNCGHIKAVSQAMAEEYPQISYFELDPGLLNDEDWATLHHWSESGNAKVAEQLASYLRRVL